VKRIPDIVFPPESEDSVCPLKVTLQTKPGLLMDNPVSENITAYVDETPKFAVIVPGPFMVADVDAAVDPDIEMEDVELVHDWKLLPVPA
jgi:hypothetical protein